MFSGVHDASTPRRPAGTGVALRHPVRIEDPTNPAASWAPPAHLRPKEPTVGPLADASRKRVCGAHNERPCDTYHPAVDGETPYWQYLERQNRRYGGAAYEAGAGRDAESSAKSTPQAGQQPDGSSDSKKTTACDPAKGGYRLPTLRDVIEEFAAADRADESRRKPLSRKVERVPVLETPGTRVDTVV
jgi:hypothetical protein